MNVIQNTFDSLKERIVNRERYTTFIAARKKLLLFGGLHSKEKALLRKVSLRLSEDDGMYVPTNEYHYLSVGLSAVRCINTVLDRANRKQPVTSVLDFPCGYGRVLRFLKVRFPEAKIMGVEIEQEYLDFCESAFNVDTAISKKDISQLKIAGKYDVIWCGSLFTHIDQKSAEDLLKLFNSKLTKNGVCVFTTHGQLPINWLKKKERDYGLTPKSVKQLLAQLKKSGYGYADYPEMPGYGVSAVTHECMTKLAKKAGKWEEVVHLEHGWDNHQDVYGYIKTV
jgi:SAM-dependent methyltransferase